MENNYRITEVWYPYNGGGEMIEVHDQQTGMPLCAEDSKLVTTLRE